MGPGLFKKRALQDRGLVRRAVEGAPGVGQGPPRPRPSCSACWLLALPADDTELALPGLMVQGHRWRLRDSGFLNRARLREDPGDQPVPSGSAAPAGNLRTVPVHRPGHDRDGPYGGRPPDHLLRRRSRTAGALTPSGRDGRGLHLRPARAPLTSLASVLEMDRRTSSLTPCRFMLAIRDRHQPVSKGALKLRHHLHHQVCWRRGTDIDQSAAVGRARARGT